MGFIDRASEARDMEFYDTQYTLLKAESLAERVGMSLKLHEQEAFFEAHGVDGAERVEVRKRQVMSLLLKNVTIEPVKKSKLVNVKYTSRSPELSSRIADAWVREFIGASMDRQFSSNADARRFLEQRLSELRAVVVGGLDIFSKAEGRRVLKRVGVCSSSKTWEANSCTRTCRTPKCAPALADMDSMSMPMVIREGKAWGLMMMSGTMPSAVNGMLSCGYNMDTVPCTTESGGD